MLAPNRIFEGNSIGKRRRETLPPVTENTQSRCSKARKLESPNTKLKFTNVGKAPKLSTVRVPGGNDTVGGCFSTARVSIFCTTSSKLACGRLVSSAFVSALVRLVGKTWCEQCSFSKRNNARRQSLLRRFGGVFRHRLAVAIAERNQYQCTDAYRLIFLPLNLHCVELVWAGASFFMQPAENS
ncbi:unnamed protein product [Hapterophycus canaliculatus]